MIQFICMHGTVSKGPLADKGTGGTVLQEEFMIRNVIALYFSPSGETAKITKKIANEIAERMNDACVDGVDVTYLDLLKEPPRSDMEFSPRDHFSCSSQDFCILFYS